MPEFRFRRKKQQNRRTTVNNAEDTARQIQEAKKLVKPVKPVPETQQELTNGKVTELTATEVAKVEEELDGPMEKRSSFVQEREKFFELLKSKYPEQAISLEVGVVKEAGSGSGTQSSEDKANVVLQINGGLSQDSGRTSDERDELSRTKLENISPCDHSQTPPTSSSRLGECLYLRHGKALRHCPMPSPITLSTIKNLYINMFELNHSLLTSPSVQIYVQDKTTMQWNKLKDISMVTDHCTLLLADSALSHTSSMAASGNSQADSDINMPLDHLTPKPTPPQERLHGHTHSLPNHTYSIPNHTHSLNNGLDMTPTELEPPKKNGLWRSGHTQQVQDLSSLPDNLPLQKNPPSLLPNSYPTPSITSSSTSPPSSTGAMEVSANNKKILSKAKELQKSVRTIKSEMSSLRQAHTLRMAELNASVSHTSQRILAAISVFGQTAGLQKVGVAKVGVAGVRRERLELAGMEQGYQKCCEGTFKDLSFLEHAVEGLRVDVVGRRCKVVETEINTMTTLLNTVIQSLKDIKDQYQPMEAKIKRVMEGELKVIVQEEKFLEEEWPRLEEASEKCDGLMQTLLTMLQVASVQSRRTPHIPHYQPVPHPDRSALMDNIMAITPNHTVRAESLAIAEELWEKKKELHSNDKMKLRKFENLLRIKKQQLHKTGLGANVDTRREMKLKASYMEDKFKQGQDGRRLSGEGEVVALEKNGRNQDPGARVVRRDSRASSEERERGRSLKVKQRSSRSQEMLLDEECELGAVGDVGRREMFQVRETWAEPRKVLHVKGDVIRQGWGRGVASQESYSQDSNYSMPPMLEIMRENRELNTGQPHSNSQPDYYQSKEAVSINSFGLTPPIKRHNKHNDFEEGKRKSIGDMRELPKVAKYFDTLERKKQAAKKNPDSQTKGVAKSQRNTPYEEMRPANLHLANSSYSGSSTASVGSGSGVVPRPSCLKSSSLVTTSSNSSYEPPQGLTSSGSSGGGAKISPRHQSQASRKGFAKEGKRSGIPRAHRGQGEGPHSMGGGEKVPVTNLKRSKKPHINGFPTRYSMGDYHHSANSRSEPLQTPSPTSPTRSRTFQAGSKVGSKVNGSPKRQGGRPENLKLERKEKPLLTSNSDDSSHESRYPDSKRLQAQQNRREVASDIFDSDTLIVDRRKKGGGARDSSSLPSSSVLRSSAVQQHNMQVRFQTNYSDHVPPGAYKATHPHKDQHPPYNVYKVAPPSSGHVTRPSQPATRTSSSQPQHASTRNSKVQFQMKPTSERPHPQQHKSGIPMRATKSAQTPHNSDTPLTSYPRSHVEALQRRSASNGRVRDMQLQHAQTGHAPHPGIARAQQGYAGGSSHPLHVGYGGNNYNDVMVGSLV